jgi:CRP/FNR family transcriptional regulator, anaerobic regulatory protein
MILCQGFAYQFVQIPDGRRQILSIVLPGDLVSTNSVFSRPSHFSVMSLTDVKLTRLKHEFVMGAISARQDVLEHLADACLSEAREKDELLVDIGRRTAEERIAHVVLRLAERLASLGTGTKLDGRFSWPLRQQHIADMTGLTPVHVSRVVTAFRKAGIFDLSKSMLTVLDWPRLESIGRLR